MAKYIFNDNSLGAFWIYLKQYLAKTYAAITSKVDNVSYSGGTLSIATPVLNEKGEPTGKTTAVVTAAKIVTDGGGITSHQDISGKADKASPAFTGTPTAPTAAAGTNSTQIATTAFVKTAVDNAKPGSASTTAAGVVKLQNSIDAKTDVALTPNAVYSVIGVNNGICPLGTDKKVPSQYLPSYVDDVIEVYPLSGKTQLAKDWLSATQGGTPIDPESGKIYVLVGTATGTTYPVNSQFRWPSGSNATAYVPILDATGFTEITKTEIEQICV